MDDPLGVREPEAIRDLDRDPHRVGGFERTDLLDPLLHGTAGEVLHHDERRIVDLADVVDRDDVRMRELCESSRLLHEHPAKVAVRGRGGIENLQRHVAIQSLVAGEVNLRRSTHTERLLDLVPTL